ncbi:FHA domain-containing protein [Ktedonosporobacter rubrisoli]|uniref:FHA domain-containing protein n=1 Tax=Ktedonosporobacter rubrisoli TaxID=2509675 RepID=A0A4V0YZ23_KTERU|nr:FHA domain-containing protein [Ktedonosporobacter rubrisoli]QBD78221.1 FHA domain-containing protein [Ktedonosporobacter rubrisoli]
MTLTSRPPTQAKPVAVPQPLPTTPEATPTTATSPLPNLPITEELPTTIESPAVEEATAVVEEAMTIAENPAVEVAPTNAEDPTVEEVPTIAESLIAEGATAVTDGLAVEETPTTAVSPAAEEAATVAESLGVEETPTTVESSATEEALAATSSPSGIEAGAATQPSKRTFSDFIPLSLPELSVLEQAETTNRQPQNQQENTPKSSSQAEAEAIFALEESQELPPFVASLTSTEPPKELIYLDRQAGTPETPSQPTKNQTHPAQAYMYIQAPGTKEPHRVLLDQDEVTIGRAGASDILLDQDTLTSRHHARLKRIDDKYVIVDQRSLHGTLLNGEQLTSEKEYPLNEGDRIAIGDYVLIFHDRT